MTAALEFDPQLHPAPPEPAPKPTPEEIDAEILFFQNAQACYRAAKETMEAAQKKLVLVVDLHGTRPPHAEQSIRLAGRRNAVTVTRGTTVTVHEPAVEELENYLCEQVAEGIFERLFARQITHRLVEGARELLKTLSLSRRTEEKVLSLFGKCVDLKTKAPTVKIEVIQPEKPARKPRASRKAAA